MSDQVARLRQLLIRNCDQVERQPFERPPRYESRGASLSEGTAAAKLGASIDEVPPGKMSCPYHYHLAHEEMFVILEGAGTLRVAGEHLAVSAGDVIFVPPGPEYPHHLINTSAGPLRYLSISTQERPEVCVYPDSGKLGVFAPGHRLIQRPANGLDYWDGEP